MALGGRADGRLAPPFPHAPQAQNVSQRMYKNKHRLGGDFTGLLYFLILARVNDNV